MPKPSYDIVHQYFCEGCGMLVTTANLPRSKSGFCYVCGLLQEANLAADEFWDVYTRAVRRYA